MKTYKHSQLRWLANNGYQPYLKDGKWYTKVEVPDGIEPEDSESVGDMAKAFRKKNPKNN